MAIEMDNEHWIPLVEFSAQRGISLSTLRRYIKANKIPWKLVEGRYLVMDDGTFTNLKPSAQESDLEAQLLSAQEEIAELKMLVAFYEEKLEQLSKK